MVHLIPRIFTLLESAPVGRFFGAEIHRVFGLDQQTFLGVAFILINLCILAFVLSKFLYKPVRKVLADRTERIQNQLLHAESEKTSANELKLQYETKIRDIDIECETLMEKARKDAEDLARKVRDEAKAEADAIRERALRNVAMEQERVKDEMKQSIIELSSVMAQKFVSRTIDRELQDALFIETITELEVADFVASDRTG
jgi:F-type H+-transporting ATPase subunit b